MFFLCKIQFLVKNQTFVKNEFWSKNPNICQTTNFFVKQKRNFWSKNRNICQKTKFFSIMVKICRHHKCCPKYIYEIGLWPKNLSAQVVFGHIFLVKIIQASHILSIFFVEKFFENFQFFIKNSGIPRWRHFIRNPSWLEMIFSQNFLLG